MHRKERKRFESNTVRRNGYEPIAQFENSQTPPEYLVREAADGRLLSDNCEVEWPKRPLYGRYSKATNNEKILSSNVKHSNEHFYHDKVRRSNETLSKNKASTNRYNRKINNNRSKNANHDYSIKKMTIDKIKKINDNDDYLFVGAQTIKAVSKLLRKNDFRLYYQVPSPSENFVPIRIPLCLAYRSAKGKIYHFPITCTVDEGSGRESWRVLYGDPRPSSFATLSALVKYHKTYSYMDPKTGAIDTFPVWKGAIIDSNDVD